jgi:putative addiction module component (TIGR02574 family)
MKPDQNAIAVATLPKLVNKPAVTNSMTSWEAEIERRLRQYDAGEVEAIDAEDVFAKARHLARPRPSRRPA